MHCDMLKIQDGGAIVEKLNCLRTATVRVISTQLDQIKLRISAKLLARGVLEGGARGG